MRAALILIVFTRCAVVCILLVLKACVTRESKYLQVGKCVADACDRLGGAVLKTGQILSTRVDLIPSEMMQPLSRLRDSATPVSFPKLEPLLRSLEEPASENKAIHVRQPPLATATIAQVYIGHTRCATRHFAIKIRRPDIQRVLSDDIWLMRRSTKLIARLPWFRHFPIVEATNQICEALVQQADFVTEADMLERFRRLFDDFPDVRIPEVFRSRCTNDIIVMEYLSGFRLVSEFRDHPELAQAAVQTGLRALFKSIFEAGLIHCDLHPSNILCRGDGTIALIDFGFVAEMTEKQRKEFAEFFLSIAFCDGQTAAKIIKETALRVQDDLDESSFQDDMQALLDRTAGKRAIDFQVAGFVFELFEVQRKHGIYGSPHFTLPILSLLTYEGMIKDIHPELDFQQEAVPFVMASLGTPGSTAKTMS